MKIALYIAIIPPCQVYRLRSCENAYTQEMRYTLAHTCVVHDQRGEDDIKIYDYLIALDHGWNFTRWDRNGGH